MKIPNQARAIERRPFLANTKYAFAAYPAIEDRVKPSYICPNPPCAWYYCAAGNYYLCCQGGLEDPDANPCECLINP